MSQANKTVRLLHISDLHLAKATFSQSRGRDFWDDWLSRRNPLCKPAARSLSVAVARTAHQYSERFDAILITGDLATTGVRDDLDTALNFLEAAPIDGRPWMSAEDEPTLRGVGCPILLMPGNHDRYRDGFGSPGGDLFDHVFDRYWSGGQGVHVLKFGDLLWIVACDLTLAVDEKLSRFDFPGKGKVYPQRLERLKEETDRLRSGNPSMPVVWAIHFPPRFGRFCGDLSRSAQLELKLLELIDEDLLIAAAREAFVSHLLCGHTHWPHFYSADDAGVFVHCAGSAMQRGPRPNTMHLVEMDIEGGQIVRFDHLGLTFDKDRGNFVF